MYVKRKITKKNQGINTKFVNSLGIKKKFKDQRSNYYFIKNSI